MSEFPQELIRQVQTYTRAAAGLSEYSPSDPTLPELPSLSASIAAFDPSPPQLRCENCKGRLLRGSESIICLCCGRGPHYDVVPEPICFTSSIGYQWLLRSLHLDGSEIVNPTDKNEQGQSSAKTLTPLSDLLNLKISWPVETEKKESSFSGKDSEESKKSLSLTGVAPDKFFFKLHKNGISDMSMEWLSAQSQSGTAGGKDVTSRDQQNLVQNVQSSESTDNSSKYKTNEAFSEWEADFQSADSENQCHGDKSSEHFVGSSADSQNKIQDSKSFLVSTGLEVDLAAHIDSVFPPGKDLNDGKPKGNLAISPVVDDWNFGGPWNNTSSNESQFAGVFDASLSSIDHPGKGTSESTQDPFATADLLQDFQSNRKYAGMTENKTMNEEHKTMDEDLFEEWNDFTGSTNSQVMLQNAPAGSEHQVSNSDQKSLGIDFFSFDNKFEEGYLSGFSQPNLFSEATGNSNALAEVNTLMSENPASNWSNDASSSSHESGITSNKGDAPEISTEDDVKMLISQMHDLSFMLEAELSIPSGSETQNSPSKD